MLDISFRFVFVKLKNLNVASSIVLVNQLWFFGAVNSTIILMFVFREEAFRLHHRRLEVRAKIHRLDRNPDQPFPRCVPCTSSEEWASADAPTMQHSDKLPVHAVQLLSSSIDGDCFSRRRRSHPVPPRELHIRRIQGSAQPNPRRTIGETTSSTTRTWISCNRTGTEARLFRFKVNFWCFCPTQERFCVD